MEKTKKCLECGAEFTVNPKARFVRKYCVKCSEKRKKLWDDRWKIKFEDLEDD